MRYEAPSTSSRAFNCPHCGAFAGQDWYTIHSQLLFSRELPEIVDRTTLQVKLSEFFVESGSDKADKKLIRLSGGKPFLDSARSEKATPVCNAWFSRCHSCKDLAFWIYDNLVYPPLSAAPLPNADLPEPILTIYNEASSILNLSPRGSAALLRLALQMLCEHLGKTGKIDKQIAALVQDGLDESIQKACDVVRVIGNNAVHPGEIDLTDNRDIAISLFHLVNIISNKLISEKKEIERLYDILPQGALDAIARRDAKKQST